MTLRLPKCLLVCHPQSSKRSAGQKQQWNDLVVSDLKKCDLLPDMASERDPWRGLVKEATHVLNHMLEEEEVRKKDEKQLWGGRSWSSSSVFPSITLTTIIGLF